MKTDCGSDHQCCKENVLRRMEFMEACKRIDERDTTIKDLRRRIQLARRYAVVTGFAPHEVLRVLDLRRPLKRGKAGK